MAAVPLDRAFKTRTLKIITDGPLGRFAGPGESGSPYNYTGADGSWGKITTTTKTAITGGLERWEILPGPHMAALQEAAARLRDTDVPVAFPTETVYGLGADATRSAAVRGIFAAKGRPSDNPLITHVCDLTMLRELLAPANAAESSAASAPVAASVVGPSDWLPAIYAPLIARFWPGPLTILLPQPLWTGDVTSAAVPRHRLAPEVSAGLSTFGVRMPRSPLALSLIKLANVPLAAPSANASTRPSPTRAEHVMEDLVGKIELILDGGPCDVGVESTVVDGLCDPPVILRPGGISFDELRLCPGWEKVQKAYKDQSEVSRNGTGAAPRAPGMKYKHYSPKAKVILYESATYAGDFPTPEDIERAAAVETHDGGVQKNKLAVIRTRKWRAPTTKDKISLDACLGSDTRDIARGLFEALRELDRQGAEVVFVEGITDEGDIAAAVMNRLRKAAAEIRP